MIFKFFDNSFPFNKSCLFKAKVSFFTYEIFIFLKKRSETIISKSATGNI